MIRRDFLGYLFGLIFLIFFMSGCTRYYNPTGTNYSKANKYYNPSPQTKTTSGINNSNRFSTTSNNNGYGDNYNNYGNGVNNTNYRGNRDEYNKYGKGVNSTNTNTNTRRGRGKYRDDNSGYGNRGDNTNTNTRRGRGKKSIYNNTNYNNEYGNRATRNNNNSKRVGSYSRPAVVYENFTNDPRYEYHMDKRRFFYKPRPKIPYYYKDGIYYYGGYYNNGAYEYRGTTLTDGEYHGDR